MATITERLLKRFVAETEAFQAEDEKKERTSRALSEKLAMLEHIERITGLPIDAVPAKTIVLIESGWNARKAWELTQ